MEPSRFIECLRADAARLREVAGRDLTAGVPSCPDWDMTDLVRHVAEVYQHKVQCIRLGKAPDPGFSAPDSGEPLALLDRSLAELLAEFDARAPTDHAFTWYGPDQSVGFWIRRMAQETAVHRVDGELAVGDVTPVAPDLALDGIDEVLVIFVDRPAEEYAKYLASDPQAVPLLAEADGRAVAVLADGRGWLVRVTAEAITARAVEPPEAVAQAAAVVRGDPSSVLLWLWRRQGDEVVRIDGEEDAAAYLWDLMEEATQ